jgi:hypothetical protein
MVLLTEAIKLTLFPAMMAFAASSDLFTMTIANRVSLILVAGFGLLAALVGMSAADMLSHAGAAAAVLAVVFSSSPAAGSAAATPSSQPLRCCGSASPTSPIISFTHRCSAGR